MGRHGQRPGALGGCYTRPRRQTIPLLALTLLLASTAHGADKTERFYQERQLKYDAFQAEWDATESIDQRLLMLDRFSRDVQGSTLIPSTTPHLDTELELAQDVAMHQWAAELSASFDQAIREAMREGRVARAAQLGSYYLNAHGPVSYTHLTLPTNREV